MKEYLNVGITLVISTVLLLFSKDRLASAFSMENFPVTQLSILLLIETLILIVLWIQASLGELQMFQDYFEEFVPPLPKSSFSIAVGIAIFLGMLGYFSDRIVIYSSIFVVFDLLCVWGGWIRASEFRAVLKRAQNEASPEDIRRKGWDIIEIYELERPHVLRSVGFIFFSVISLILGLLGGLLYQPSTIWLISTSYIIMLLNIAFSEVIIMRWRRERDIALNEPYF